MSLLNKGIMANLLTPIVLNFPDRGACAVDYIDYFDEGQYGPDKAFFVNRFRTLDEIAEQMDKCLALQTNLNSMIHVNRCNISDKWMDYFTSKNDKYPQRAQYKIRFLLRFKFYGDYAYIDLGVKWRLDDDLDTINPIIIKKDDLEVINRCWISENDAKYILTEITNKLTFDGTQTYDITDNNIRKMTEDEQNKLDEEKAISNATLLSDGENIFVDLEGKPIGL